MERCFSLSSYNSFSLSSSNFLSFFFKVLR
jgi:hypothetical protein